VDPVALTLFANRMEAICDEMGAVLRRGSGGAGARPGGAGLVREYEFLSDAQVTVLTERRRRGPWGLAGGESGQPGVNRMNGIPLPAKVSLRARAGDRLVIETPGGGGWGPPAQARVR